MTICEKGVYLKCAEMHQNLGAIGSDLSDLFSSPLVTRKTRRKSLTLGVAIVTGILGTIFLSVAVYIVCLVCNSDTSASKAV